MADERGNYASHVFAREAIRLVQEYDSGKDDEEEPLFLYLAIQAVHCPTQEPPQNMDVYKNRTDWTDVRKIYAGMLSAADEAIGNVTQAGKMQVCGKTRWWFSRRTTGVQQRSVVPKDLRIIPNEVLNAVCGKAGPQEMTL